MKLISKTLLCCALSSVAVVAHLRGEVVTVDSGSYLTTRPEPCKALPGHIYRTADLEGPMLTGQWWSSLLWQSFSQALFAHPLAMRCSENGLELSYPGSHITANKHGIFGLGIPKGGDLTIAHSNIEKFDTANCGGFSDWFVTAVFGDSAKSLRTTFGHGSPFVFCEISDGEPKIDFHHKPQMWASRDGAAVVGVTVNGHHYGLFGPTGSSWKHSNEKTIHNVSNAKGYFTIAILPDKEPSTLAQFASYAHNHIIDSSVTYTFRNGHVNTTYEFEIDSRENGEKGTLFALYPHQWKYTNHELMPQTYGSVRGLMKMGAGERFTTTVPVQGVLPRLPDAGITDRDRMLGYLSSRAEKKPRDFADTYWEGKHLGELASLAGVAEAANAPELQEVFIDELKRRLEEWFTARPDKTQPVFYYDSNWGSLIGSRPSYGSDNPLNDHHFHYGYFIRSAAEVARHDPEWATKWGGMVELLIRDIATSDRDDSMFPYLRNFDKYAGHSWASGDANFGDGNNQESSSESMNAWYGMMLWGEVTGNRSLRDLGVALFNTERTAVEEYWFDVSGNNYPEQFPGVALGMVWGGKGAFGTWFSGEIDCIHGINWLPFTPASFYMGRHPSYVKKNHDRIMSVRKGGDDYNTGWGDLVCMFNALQDPASSAAFMETNPNCKLEDGNTHAFMYHWIYTLNNLGLNDPNITADHPFVNVYVKDGKRTYAAYHFGDAPRDVTFSDGTVLIVQPKSVTVK